MWQDIEAAIQQATGSGFTLGDRRSVGGGSINQTYQLLGQSGQGSYFLKLNRAETLAMFEAEALGLQEMGATGALRIPQPIVWGTAGSSAYLVLEWLDLGRSQGNAWYAMGQGLATMHRMTSQHGFGWHRDNTIGTTPQPNPWTADWCSFWRDHRLGYQLTLAQGRGGSFPQGSALLDALPDLLAGHDPAPALVHGDLWSGNGAVTVQGEPVIFDPAVYYGDREVDIAMTELFGGFPAPFYQGYRETYPLPPGYDRRKTLYNLYHILNHFNLFGGSYASQANHMIARLLV